MPPLAPPPRPPRMPPPLNALRAFEAAARLGGFQAAAEELCVTPPGAVAQHVRSLEAYLQADLFTRHARGVTLTPLGQGGALARFTAAFDGLGAAVQHLRSEAGGEVQIAALPAIAQLWLTPPRLPALRAALPGLRLSVTALEAPPNLTRDPLIWRCFSGGEGVGLAEDALLPVAAPGVGGWDAPRLSDATWVGGDWAHWLAAMGGQEDAAPPKGGAVHSLYALAVDEACAGGAGVLMGHQALLASHLADGRLVALAKRLPCLPPRLCSPRLMT